MNRPGRGRAGGGRYLQGSLSLATPTLNTFPQGERGHTGKPPRYRMAAPTPCLPFHPRFSDLCHTSLAPIHRRLRRTNRGRAGGDAGRITPERAGEVAGGRGRRRSAGGTLLNSIASTGQSAGVTRISRRPLPDGAWYQLPRTSRVRANAGQHYPSQFRGIASERTLRASQAKRRRSAKDKRSAVAAPRQTSGADRVRSSWCVFYLSRHARIKSGHDEAFAARSKGWQRAATSRRSRRQHHVVDFHVAGEVPAVRQRGIGDAIAVDDAHAGS